MGTRRDGLQHEHVLCVQSSSSLLQIPGNKLESVLLIVKRFEKLNRSQEIGTQTKNDMKVYLVAVKTSERFSTAFLSSGFPSPWFPSCEVKLKPLL